MIYTGNRRANQFQDACLLAAQQGYRIDASLKAPLQTPLGPRNGWCEAKTKTIWIYVSSTVSDKVLHKRMLHEVGHARYDNRVGAESWWRTIRKLSRATFSTTQVDEDQAEVHAWGRLTATQRSGVGFNFHGSHPPTAAQIKAAIS